MKSLILVTLLAGCGAIFAPNQTDVDITAPDNMVVEVDGRPTVMRHLHVNAHQRHTVTGEIDGKVVATCNLEPTVQARYIVGDILLFETVVPLIVDGVTDDWAYIEDGSCNLGGAP